MDSYGRLDQRKIGCRYSILAEPEFALGIISKAIRAISA
jgi:hypothetical protein